MRQPHAEGALGTLPEDAPVSCIPAARRPIASNQQSGVYDSDLIIAAGAGV
jgi:hypothetical protein